MAPLLKVAAPDGMGEAMESLAKAILESQPEDIYEFAFKYFETLIEMREAQNTGLSPSSTEESNSKGPVVEVAPNNDDRRTSISNAEEKIPEEPQSNDTSYGVEATAVRTLAASTGTVAILGTTAQTQGQKEAEKADEKEEIATTVPETIAPPEIIVKDDKTEEKTASVANEEAAEAIIENKPTVPKSDADESTEIALKVTNEPDEAKHSLAREEAQELKENSETKESVETPKPEEPAQVEEEQKSIDVAPLKEIQESVDSKVKGESIESKESVEAKEELIVTKEQKAVENAVEEIKTEVVSPIKSPVENDKIVAVEEETLNDVGSKTVSPSDLTGQAEGEVTSETVAQSETVVSTEPQAESNLTLDKNVQQEANKEDDSKGILQDELNDESLSAENDVSLPSPEITARTNDEDDNDISSEQLKTNSLSDVSMSETIQSETEEKSDQAIATTLISDLEQKVPLLYQEASPLIEINSPSESSDNQLSSDLEKNNSETESSPLQESPTQNSSLDNGLVNESTKDMDAAATTIQSNIRGFLTRKQLKNASSPSDDESKKLSDSLIDKLKDEVDEICKEAEETTESLINSPDIGNDAIIPNDEFPAPPDDMLLESVKLDESQYDITLSLNSEPTVPSLAQDISNQAAKETKDKLIDGNKSLPQSPQQNDLENALPLPDLDDNSVADGEQIPNDEDLPAPDFEMLESSYTDDVNTEVINDSENVKHADEELRDSTEGDLTIDEDSDKLKDLQKPQECDELRNLPSQDADRTQKEIDEAASKIQAGVRGYLTRKQNATSHSQPQHTPTAQSPIDESEKKPIEGKSSDEKPIEGKQSEDKAIDESTPNKGKADTPLPNDSPVHIEDNKGEPKVSDDKEIWNALEKELNDAATTIQANFRGYMARKDGKDKETLQEDSEANSAANTMQTDKPSESSEKSTTPETEPVQSKDGEDNTSDDLLNDSAVKIQAGVRGYLVRKKQQAEKEAAVKIQAGFKGFKVRQQLKDQN